MYIIFILLAAVIFYIFLICPRLINKPDMSSFCVNPISHRGIFNNTDVIENTLEAFEKSCSMGYGIELDVRLSADGVPVVIHDENLKRIADFNGIIRNMSVAEIKSHILTPNGETVPTLEEVIQKVNGRVPLLIEIKGVDYEISKKIYNIMKNYKGIYAVESFDPRNINRYMHLAPKVPRGILVSYHRDMARPLDKAFAYITEGMLLNFYTRPDFVAMQPKSYKYNWPVKLCSLLGVRKLVWTVYSKEELSDAEKLYDGFICENLDTIM